MKLILKQALKGGLVGTGLMTIALLLTPLLGLPYRSMPSALAEMMEVPLVIGWIIHFAMGIFFAIVYALLFLKLERQLSDDMQKKISSRYVKGAVFGVIVFACTQVINLFMKAIFGGVALPEEKRLLLLLSSLVGHVIFGIIVALFAKEKGYTSKTPGTGYSSPRNIPI